MSDNNSLRSAISTFSQEIIALVDDLAKLTVLVNARKRMPTSGLMISSRQILTVDHGVEKEEDIEIISAGNGVVSGRLVGRDPGTDLALITLEQDLSDIKPVKISVAKVGMPVVMIGRPEPEGHQASYGIVTSIGSGLRTMKGSVLDQYIASDATPYPGFSGGPLVSFDSTVIGINTSGLVGGLSLAIPTGIALDVAVQLSRFGRVKRGFLGIRSQRVEILESLRKLDPTLKTTGLLVVGLDSDGPAAVSGIMIGDILFGAGDRSLADQDDLATFLAGDVAGKELNFHLVRGGQPKDVTVKVGER
jgi:S1-C subfamily serine protease